MPKALKSVQCYAAKAFISQLAAGGLPNLKPIIFLAFVDVDLSPKKKAYKRAHVTLDKKNAGKRLG